MVLDTGDGQSHARASLPPVLILLEAECAPRPAWTDAENLANTGIRSPDRSARSESLYWLRYSGPQRKLKEIKVILLSFDENFYFF